MENKTSRRGKGTGSIFKKRGKYVYQWKCVTGKEKTKTLNALTLAEAQKEIESIQQEEIRLSAIDSKIAYIHQIAEAKALLHVCRIPLNCRTRFVSGRAFERGLNFFSCNKHIGVFCNVRSLNKKA